MRPVVDRAAGASMRNWARVLEHVVNAHARDTIYIFGHAGEGLPVTGNAADLLHFRDYLGAVLAFVERHVAAGRSREEILAMRAPAPWDGWLLSVMPGGLAVQLAGSDAEDFYRALGYELSGLLPDYACNPDGEYKATAIYYKLLSRKSE